MTTKNDDTVQAFNRLVSILMEKYKSEKFDIKDNNEEEVANRPKIVFLIGAGASSWSGKKEWKELSKEIFDIILDSYGNSKIVIDEIWTDLSSKLGLRQNDWNFHHLERKLRDSLQEGIVRIEDVANTACKVKAVDENIRKVIIEDLRENDQSAGHPPQLIYELISHLLKHSFCDDIITFNFDEILDISLENEIGKENFDMIISEQQIVPNLNTSRPKYIKLHGSVSSPQSLKYTEKETGKLSNAMIKILDESIFYRNETINKNVKFVSLGYSWIDPDIANWIRSRQNYINEIIILQHKSSEVPKTLRGAFEDNIKIIANSILNKDLSIDQFIWSVWNELERRLIEEEIPFVPASRHIILGHLFGPNVNRLHQRFEFLNKHDADKRLEIEVFMHLIKCKGMINLSIMSKMSKIHRYLLKYKDFSHNKKDIFFDEINFLRKEKQVGIRETYFSVGDNVQENVALFDIDNKFQKGRIKIPMFNSESNEVELQEHNFQSFWDTEFNKIFNSPEIEVIPDFDMVCEWSFNSPVKLKTWYKLFSASEHIIYNNNWTHLLLISETGEWLLKNEKLVEFLKGKNDRQIFLIQASPIDDEVWQERSNIDEELKRQIRILSNIEIFTIDIDWWEHNRHMTLALNLNTERIFLNGIYFNRPLKTTQISPVFIKETFDCLELYKVFKFHIKKYNDDKNRNNIKEEFINEFKLIENKIEHKYGDKI